MASIISVCFIVVVFSCPNLWAEHQETKTEKGQEISTLVLMRNDWIKTEDKESVQSQEFLGYWLWEKKIGGGIDVVTTPKSDCITVKAFGTLNLTDSVRFVGGTMTTSYGSDFLYCGVWILQNIGQWRLYLDLREYTEISGKRSDFTDDLIEITYPVTDKLSLGAVGMYDRWWQDNDHNWFFIGPIGYYQLSKSMKVFCRPSLDWERVNDTTIRTAKVRFGVKLAF
ncbi:MAG: hypothetical protein WA019_00720 [Candidatus Moraniibacteriota bacterium]